jgi:uncharacterized protein (DUF433 family)
MTTDRIDINPEIMLGKPVIRGTRITVELVLRRLSEGATEADLLDAYPHLTPADIKAAIAYAADRVATEPQLPKTKAASEGLRERLKLRERYRGKTSPTDVVRAERDGR